MGSELSYFGFGEKIGERDWLLGKGIQDYAMRMVLKRDLPKRQAQLERIGRLRRNPAKWRCKQMFLPLLRRQFTGASDEQIATELPVYIIVSHGLACRRVCQVLQEGLGCRA